MMGRALAYLASVALIAGVVRTLQAPEALLAAQQAGSALAIGVLLLLISSLLPHSAKRRRDSMGWMFAVALLLAVGAAAALTQPTAAAATAPLVAPSAGRLYGAAAVAALTGIGTLVTAIVIYLGAGIGAGESGARAFTRFALAVVAPLFAVVVLCFMLAYHALAAAGSA